MQRTSLSAVSTLTRKPVLTALAEGLGLVIVLFLGLFPFRVILRLWPGTTDGALWITR